MTADRLDELIALAALGELSEAEERELDDLLAGDDVARSELRSTLDVAAAVQATVAEPPPAALRDRVLAATAGLAQEPAGERPGESADPPPVAPVVDLGAHRRRRVMAVVGAAAAAVVMIVGAAVIVTDGDRTDPVAEVIEADDVRRLSLTGELDGLDVYFSRAERALVVDGTDVRRPSGTNTFELWLVGDDGAIPVGLFRPDDEGRVEQRFDDVDITGFVLGVTEEPAGGSARPTLPILASA